MKICFTVDSMGSGGAERVVSILANNFVKRGHAVYIVMVSSEKDYSFYDLCGVELICLMKNYKKKTRGFKRINLLKTTLKKISPDVVIAFLPHVSIYTFFALRHTGIKMICSERNDPSKLSLRYRMFLKYIFKRVSGNVFQTEDAKKWYSKNISNNFEIIFNPINSDIKYLDIRERSNKIVSVGRLVPQKNFHLLIDAFSLFSHKHSDLEYELRIYGNGPLLNDLQQYAKTKGVSEKVVFLGNSKTWLEDDADAKMFILSSNFEGMPNSLMEALATGIPCISTDCPVGGPRELINDKSNGLLIPVGDVNGMSDAMEKIDNIAFGYKLSSSNKFMVSKYSEDIITDKWISFVERVIKD